MEEAFGDFNEKAFMDAACRVQSILSEGEGSATPRHTRLLGLAPWALVGASHPGAIPVASP